MHTAINVCDCSSTEDLTVDDHALIKSCFVMLGVENNLVHVLAKVSGCFWVAQVATYDLISGLDDVCPLNDWPGHTSTVALGV